MALRHAVLVRDGFRCRQCGRPGRLEADHVVPIERGGTDAMENLQALCAGAPDRCHDRKTALERGRAPDPEAMKWRRYLREARPR